MIRDKIINLLAQANEPETSKSIMTSVFDTPSPEALATSEIICRYSPEISEIEGKWTVVKKNRSSMIMAEISNYSESTGKKIFRLSAALDDLPAHEHPTQQEIEKAIELSNGRFTLLPNAMVKRNS